MATLGEAFDRSIFQRAGYLLNRAGLAEGAKKLRASAERFWNSSRTQCLGRSFAFAAAQHCISCIFPNRCAIPKTLILFDPQLDRWAQFLIASVRRSSHGSAWRQSIERRAPQNYDFERKRKTVPPRSN